MQRRRGIHKGYGVWRPAGTRVKLPSTDMEVEGEVQTTCPGLMLHRAVDRYGKGLPHWNITHTASGMKIVTAGTKQLGRRAAKVLCRAKKECGIGWDVDSDQIVGNDCMWQIANEANMIGQRGYAGLGQGLKHCDEPDEHFDEAELDKGTEVEFEHTDDRSTARCIAKAHLLESPFYYQELEKMEKRLKRKTPKFLWKHTGGGCAMGPLAEGESHPCDDTYENVITGEEVWVDTTQKAHFKMPKKAKTMEHVWKRAGVKKRG